ncbi:MAG TPA: tRNA (adenosine(37)-N6)-dimethylallyltransferase MiaA [Polyangiaceae bacterium]|jgi:tRNA dimethylallyltransferase|nr:tRNA (adenosine(37)-N6)-dimethylallyltransferase MiaA [Polyangiaceae bacterium]
MTSDDRLWVVVGPTASGKTALAVELCEAHDGEIVSADSVQVYRHFDVGSGKPSAEERARARQHLIDVIEPNEPMDAARFTELAELAIAEIRGRGKRPIVCGGTFLWVRALLHGLVPAPPADAALRARHQARVNEVGRAGLHADLGRVDPEAARRLAPNDFVRVSRALEVFELTGVRMSDWQAAHGFKTSRHEARLLGVRREKAELDQLILARCRAMLAAGWVAEATRLLQAGYAETRPFSSVGYKQIAQALSREEPIDLAELELAIFRATRVFARRQRTWLRDQPIEWLTPGSTKL